MNPILRSTLVVVVLVTSGIVSTPALFAQAAAPVDETARLAEQLAPFVECLSGTRGSFSLSVDAVVPIDGKQQTVKIRLSQFDGTSFDLEVKHSKYALTLRRRANRTTMILPLHKIAFAGEGSVSGNDTLGPAGIGGRLFGPGSMASAYYSLVSGGNPKIVAALLVQSLKLGYDAESNTWTTGKKVTIQFDATKKTMSVRSGDLSVQVTVSHAPAVAPNSLNGLKVVAVERAELERHLVRGVRRGLEVVAPSPRLTVPAKQDRSVPHGQLRWINGHRVVLLHGTPKQIGYAHGQLLKAEADRCIDSVLHMFGTAQTIHSGRWFKHDLEAAYKRLEKHIPDDHKIETLALAKSLGWDPQIVQTVNVFPELFHCSGFAVFGAATKDGKLYHGRVLDYMTTIGLQDAATTMIVAVDGKIPFVSVGYAGFIGSVSGMNAQAISLGEMGGRGEGRWDGVPMATLMRRALEECSTLDQVKQLWKTSPRTCEYFYVFADGKSNQAVGVAATPDSLEFINPGQTHPLLGDGIEDVVVLSAGSRLKTLRARVKERYGQIDTDVAKWLMSRPVAMSSNLHNVLFVPADGVLYIANADHKRPAAERPYVRLDLKRLLASMKANPAAASVERARSTSGKGAR